MVDYGKLQVEVTDEPVPLRVRRSKVEESPIFRFVLDAFKDGKARRISPLSPVPGSASPDSKSHPDESEMDRVARELGAAIQTLKRKHPNLVIKGAARSRQIDEHNGVVLLRVENKGELSAEELEARKAHLEELAAKREAKKAAEATESARPVRRRSH